MTACEEIVERLTLYLDNELQGDERIRFEAHVKECHSCRAVLEREQEFLKTVRESQPLYVASPELRARIKKVLGDVNSNVEFHNASAATTRSRITWNLAAAAVLILLILPVLVWRLRDDDGSIAGASNFALVAAETHLRHRRGQLPLEMASTTPQEVSEWFANKVGFSVRLPNYQDSSGQEKLYTLEGARLVGYKDDYAAYVAYEMKGRPISLLITSDSVAKPSGGEEIKAKGLTFHYNAIHGLKVITWSDRGLTYALVSDLEERGQQSCIVCHQGAKDQDFITPLKPR
jgi:anti-sigma factor RsiW